MLLWNDVANYTYDILYYLWWWWWYNELCSTKAGLPCFYMLQY